MKNIFSILFVLTIFSCKKDKINSTEKRDFIVSKFNNDNEKRVQESLLKNPELTKIKETDLYDYPKGAINFIFLKDNTIYFYNEELISNWCGWKSNEIEPMKRTLSKDSLHKINFNRIYSLLKSKSSEKSMKNHTNMLHYLSFSFENDTIRNFDIYKLLQAIDSLGYHSYTVRKIAPFETKAIDNKN